MVKFALALRGHERSSFSTPYMRNFIESILDRDDLEIDIYIQTWTSSECEKSWRPVQKKKTDITEYIIKEYFGEIICARIKSILIIDESDIQIPGRVEGNLGRTLLPIKSWKNMWMGKYRLAEEILFHNIDYAFVLNMRLDHFLCLFNKRIGVMDKLSLNSFINKAIYFNFDNTQCLLVTNKKLAGIDNIYACTVNFFQSMCADFYTNLDELLLIFGMRTHQEFLVFDYIHRYADRNHLVSDRGAQ